MSEEVYFRLGELVVCSSSTRVDPRLRGQIVEIVAKPRPIESMGKQWAYTIQHEAGRFYACQDILRELSAPGTRPCDLTYDGNLVGSWEDCVWRPSDDSSY